MAIRQAQVEAQQEHEATVAELEEALEQLHGLECAVRAEFLAAAARYAESQAWVADGARSLAEWLAARFSMSTLQARELARVAQALVSLPRIAETFAQGRISFDQLRALTHFATPETDEALADSAPHTSLRMLEVRARRTRTMRKRDAEALHQSRWLTLSWRGDRLVLHGEFSGAEAKAVEAAILRALEAQPRPPEGHDPDPFDARLADALHAICSGALGADPDPDRATVVVYTDAEALAADEGMAEIDGLTVSSETARRLCCDGRVQEILEYGGIPVGIGTVSRTVPHALRRELRRRDQGCRFPGCARERWVHAHHVWHWAHGGPTDLGNLVLLCGYHHHFVHEGEWAIQGNPMGELEFIRPDGRVFGPAPPELRSEHREWLDRALP